MFYYTTHYYQDLCNSAAVIVTDKIWHRLITRETTSTIQAVKLAYIRVFYFMMVVKLLLCSELPSVPL